MILRYSGTRPEIVPHLGGTRVIPGQLVKVPERIGSALIANRRWEEAGLEVKKSGGKKVKSMTKSFFSSNSGPETKARITSVNIKNPKSSNQEKKQDSPKSAKGATDNK